MQSLAPRLPRPVTFVALCSAIFLLASCAHQPQAAAYHGLPGFWLGLLHGFLIFFSFIGSLFTHVRIYAYPNSGGWYDFGYLLGAAMFLGGGAKSAK
ncbi:MAG: hypothetical protein WAO35_04685 [Terriglobia bacterium]